MRQNRLGLLLLGIGGLLLATRLQPRGLFMELVWLAGFIAVASVLWRALEGRVPPRIRVIVHGAVGLMAAITLDRLSGAAFLGFVALAFWLVYTRGRRGRPTGWALIPAGVLTSLAAVAGVDALFPRWDGGSIFLLGMTATFTLIYLLPREQGGARWALWPALAWAGITLLANDPAGGLARWLLPLALIGAGVAILGWARGRRRP